MQVEAIYDHGRLELPANIHLKHSRIKLAIIIPDNEIEVRVKSDSADLDATIDVAAGLKRDHLVETPTVQSIREEIDEILGPWKHRIQSGSALAAEDYDRLRHEALEEKYLDRK